MLHESSRNIHDRNPLPEAANDSRSRLRHRYRGSLREKVRIALRPAVADSGIQFLRTDIKGALPIQTSAENVSDTTLATSVADGGVSVSTVEHLMSALWGLGIDNLIIELSAEEVPIMDGSAAPLSIWLKASGSLNKNKLVSLSASLEKFP